MGFCDRIRNGGEPVSDGSTVEVGSSDAANPTPSWQSYIECVENRRSRTLGREVVAIDDPTILNLR